jgi:hypothetical protein
MIERLEGPTVGTIECIREQDVLDALSASRWPGRVDEELRTHVTGCAVCRALAAVVQPLLAARDDSSVDIRVPASGTVWWRAQIRAKQEAALKVGQPISIAQVLAAVVALVLAVAVYSVFSESLDAWWARTAGIVSVEVPSLFPELNTDSPWRWIIVLVVAAWLVLTPVAIYFAFSED